MLPAEDKSSTTNETDDQHIPIWIGKTVRLHLNPFNASCSTLLLFEGSAPYWSNPPFLIFDTRSARMSEIKNGGLGQYGNV